MGDNDGAAEAAGEDAHHAVEGSVGAVALDAGDVLAVRARSVGDGHGGDGAAVPEVGADGDHVVHLGDGNARVGQGSAGDVVGHFREGIGLVFFELGLGGSNDGYAFHYLSPPWMGRKYLMSMMLASRSSASTISMRMPTLTLSGSTSSMRWVRPVSAPSSLITP